MIDAGAIIRVFDSTFALAYRTVLQGGAPEPEYVPPSAAEPGRILFREDFAASALHEVAHWCIAGRARRCRHDYGYWYESARDEAAQARFEAAEARPQAMEWIFSNAAGLAFRVSCDNLGQDSASRARLRAAVGKEARAWLVRGLPLRAGQFAAALAAASGQSNDYLRLADYEDEPR